MDAIYLTLNIAKDDPGILHYSRGKIYYILTHVQ